MISVIVTIFNREKYLEECLKSLVNQTYRNFEAILVDDGSTDQSNIIAKKYASNDNRFKYIFTEHIGFPAAKNLGLDNAEGDYIIFLDSDDSAYPQWLELLYKAISDTKADISTCYYDEYFKDKAEEPTADFYDKHPLPIAEYSYLKMNLIYHKLCSSYLWNKLIKRELYKDIRFKDQIALSDISEIYKIVDKANKVIQIQLPLIHYRRHIDSMGDTAVKNGIDYYIFRAGVLEESAEFVWDNYPQSRFAVQLMLSYELSRITKVIGKDNFFKYIDRPFFREVFNTKIDKYTFRV